MAINAFCKVCKTSYKRSAKKCPKCGSPDRKDRAYRVRLIQDGKEVSRVVDNFDLADDLENALKSKIRRGEHALGRKKSVITLSEFWDKHYLPWAKENKKSSWNSDESRYTLHIKEPLGDKPLDKITPWDIEKVMSTMRNAKTTKKTQGKKKTKKRKDKPYSPTTIRHILTLLSKIFNLAIKGGILNTVNPCSRVDKPKIDNQVTNYLSSDEIGKLFEVLDSWPDRTAAGLILFDLYTGARRSSLFRLKWTDINVDNRTMRIYLKGGKHVEMNLSMQSMDILRQTPKISEYVFPGKVKKLINEDGSIEKKYSQRTDIKHSWEAIKTAAGIARPFRFHDIRHNLASKLVSAGVPLYEVQKILAHKEPRTTMRYAHLDPERMQRTTDRGGQIIADSGKKEKEAEKKLHRIK